MSEEKCEKYSDGKTHIRKGFCTDYFWRDCSDVEECVYKLKQQLQTAKEENEKLKMDKEHYFKESAEFLAQKTILGEANDTKLEIIKDLTQQNKQMREEIKRKDEALEDIAQYYSPSCDCGLNSISCPDLGVCRLANIAQQALKGWE